MTASLWPLGRDITFLNHGSFGSCPRAVLKRQSQLRAQLERQPVTFLVRDLEQRLDEVRKALGKFLGADASDLALLTNATTGVNTVLRSLKLRPNDELLITDHAYNACRNALDAAAKAARAKVVVATVPFPLHSEQQITAAILAAVTPRTRLALIDHISSPTALVFPVATLVRELGSRGVDTLVDGAHAPGMVALDIASLGAAYYTGNCHKWMCAPKGAGFLWVRPDLQKAMRPLAISHGANDARTDRSRFQLEFGWTGTADPTALLCVPFAIDYLASLVPGGWPALMRRNRALALRARAGLCKGLDIAPPCPESMIGSMAALPLPDAIDRNSQRVAHAGEPLQERLWRQRRIEVPVIRWPASPKRLLRVSVQLYNRLPDYEKLARALQEPAP
jgi:isopenicillin-N epimerase